MDLISRSIAEKVLMIGVKWKNNAPGGISSVVNTYSSYFEPFNYLETAASRDDSTFKKLIYAITGLVRFLFRMIFDPRIKIVHVQGSHGASFKRKKLFVRIAKSFNKKVIWHMHASQFIPFYESSKNKQAIVRALNSADYLIVLSQFYYDFYKSIGIEEDKLVILNNIVKKNEHCSVKKATSDKLHLLFLGEISERKGAFDIVKAFGNDPDLAKKVELRIGGNGDGEGLIKAINNVSVEESVAFEGWVSGKKKSDLLEWANVYILPSFNEGLPISILEALSYGCPIISTPVGGIEEVVHDETRTESPLINGKIVSPGDTLQIASAIRYYIENPEMIEKHSKNSLEIVKDFYPEKVFETLSEIYNNCL